MTLRQKQLLEKDFITLVKRIEEDKQAFDALYNALLEIGDISARAIRDGEKGYKRAVVRILRICRTIQ